MWIYVLLAEERTLSYPLMLSRDWQGIMLRLSELKMKAGKYGYDEEHDSIPKVEPDKPDHGLLDTDCNLGSVRYDRGFINSKDGKIEYVLWREWMI